MPVRERIKGGISELDAYLCAPLAAELHGATGSTLAVAPVTYAIIFILDAPTLEITYPTPIWTDAYKDIAKFLRGEGFDRQQGSVYFGNDDVDVVRCQMAVQKLTFEFDWFGPSVKDIRMLRIEDNNNLMPAIELAMQMKAK